MPHSTLCPFCQLAKPRIVARNEHGVVVRDAYPVSTGHSLVIPSRHVTSYFELSPAERSSLWALLDLTKSSLDLEFGPAAYNVGINDGVAAGQTVPHLHIHLIPRYVGDIADPRGGIRWVLPDKARYWT